MANFSVNQNRHLYVVKNVVSGDNAITNAGAIKVGVVKHNPAVQNSPVKELYFEYMGAKGNKTRTDLIPLAHLLSTKAVSGQSDSQKYFLKKKVVKLANLPINGTTPIGGQDYILNIHFRQYIGISDEETYDKYGAVRAFNGMTEKEFYVKMAVSLYQNLSREEVKLVDVAVCMENVNASDEVTSLFMISVTSKSKATDSAFDETYVAGTGGTKVGGIMLTEVAQDWVRGLKPIKPVYFEVCPSTVVYSGAEFIWGDVTDITKPGSLYYSTTISNGKRIADLEYFCMGERGDYYRLNGYPHVIPTEYLVDETKVYDILEMHYAYVGSDESVQKSERDIEFVADTDNHTVINDLITAINSATGLTIATLS